MFSGDLFQLIQEKSNDLMRAVSRIGQSHEKLAKADMEYNVAKQERVMKLRDSNMPATLINVTVRGYPEVAKAKFERDIAIGYLEANKEYINATKLILRLAEAQYNREYSNLSVNERML